MTYLPVAGRWMFLATVLDIGTLRLVGYSMAEHIRTDLVVDALNAAVQTHGGDVAGVIFHSDHGVQYRAAAFADACAAAGLRQSMGVVGSSADNALAEAFFASLIREILPADGWPTSAPAGKPPETPSWPTPPPTKPADAPTSAVKNSRMKMASLALLILPHDRRRNASRELSPSVRHASCTWQAALPRH